MSPPAEPYFLVEWYRPDLVERYRDEPIDWLGLPTANATAASHPVRLLLTVATPADETVFGLFSADCADAVVQSCQLAGWPVDRITSGVDVKFRPTTADRRR
ncbi:MULTISPECIES: hypothetical protein [Mycobacterium]|uniref:Uncharacterized protein n=1 Tax=Mycobacterium kiyosense TaxID=2871094 RepID=A0A9P3Q677_9MYCO|nr:MULTISPECIES: hypothetical protein [Mycobacterium]BDB44861.1 hypothetical protein IWGMT90018_53070 [Mycobacterium kiyosense]BDE16347.1 hypothetical protein MKCMC460_52070 [Mycobacterium sp. 20KCMC460]GLB82823.1 hypothetical protein SRL2020028_20790 [Mycobacterium kiyosense]GLB89439.1 hypothetical protein SRL2020130_22560 [Mycobacterium kiyosense]GLB94937.1 hypothetical protein SRL2020226_17130 [Mycobacterium kiyosense]